MAIKVKICGITRVEDAVAAVEAGADAIGLMFFERSPRFVSWERAAEVVAVLPPQVSRVGVFVDPTAEEVRRAIAAFGIDTLQFHGGESVLFCRQFGLKVLKAFRIRGPESLGPIKLYNRESWLLDSYVAGEPGGTGATFNWELAAEAVRWGGQVYLAGGLTVDNVAAAIRQVQPFGVDVSSGVERQPGWKDFTKIRAFIEAVRETATDPRES